jgi:hypothetical protein
MNSIETDRRLLTATFRFTIPPILASLEIADGPLTATLGDFVVNVNLDPDSSDDNTIVWQPPTAAPSYVCKGGLVRVTRLEQSLPPSSDADPKDRASYFRIRNAYEEAADTALRRLIGFVRHSLRQAVDGSPDVNPNAAWVDGLGNTLEAPSVRSYTLRRNILGEVPVNDSHRAAVTAAIAVDQEAPLHAQFLADFSDSLMSHNIRRAVMELAIACEVFVKTTAFGSDRRASRMYEAIDGTRAHVPVPQLIQLLGETRADDGVPFQDEYPDASDDIDHLFQARNKVAHRGIPSFRPRRGNDRRRQEVTQVVLTSWFASVNRLTQWAQSLGD